MGRIRGDQGCADLGVAFAVCACLLNAEDEERGRQCIGFGRAAVDSDKFVVCVMLSSFWTNTGNAALWGPELVFEALPSIMNCYVFCKKFLGPVAHVGFLDCFQHDPALGIVSKRSENDTPPYANVAAANGIREYLEILCID